MPSFSKKYCQDIFNYRRYITREVSIGDVPLGGNNPIRIQSMTTTDTMDTIATVEQTIRMVHSGCDYVRITAPSLKDAQNLQEIKSELRRRGYSVPLIADIHFTPNAAELAARIVEKVRINPGNYVDKKRFEQIDYTDAEYNEEIERIRERFTPLVKICREYGTAMRIGANHGSLSDRIMSRYGDTPLGMVESAMEFLRICGDLDYHNIVLSMKSSNPQVMVQAYRLLINKMQQEGMNYPLHLGVTEAGDGLDGRIKSAAGIGALLADGIGDTIRVSLTEPPENEAPVAILLAERYLSTTDTAPLPEAISPESEMLSEACGSYDPFSYKKRDSFAVLNIGGNNPPVVFADLSEIKTIVPGDLSSAGLNYDAETDKWHLSDQAADLVYFGSDTAVPESFPSLTKAVFDYKAWLELENRGEYFPFFTLDEYKSAKDRSPLLNLVAIRKEDIPQANLLSEDKTAVIVLFDEGNRRALAFRKMLFELNAMGIRNPVILKTRYKDLHLSDSADRRAEKTKERLALYSSADFSSLLFDGFGDGLWLCAMTDTKESAAEVNTLLFGILQSARLRISKTEYISCPSCGRTLFDLQMVTASIRTRTSHLKGVKIAIMGCIVNGPGEMADADYGYVGSGPGKITLYRGKEVVKRNIASEGAVELLIDLIKEDGNWREE